MFVGEIKHRVLNLPETYDQIAKLLLEKYPGKRGYTARGIHCFCQEQGISRRSELDKKVLDSFVWEKVSLVLVGHS